MIWDNAALAQNGTINDVKKYHQKQKTYLKGTNFCWYLILRVEKRYFLRVLIFANYRLQKDLRVLIFANLDFLLLIGYSQSLQSWYKIITQGWV